METFRCRRGEAPLVVSIPHAGTHLPEELATGMTAVATTMADTDWHVDVLYDFLDALDATVIVATHSRYVIDLNRPPDGAALYPGQDETSLYLSVVTFGEIQKGISKLAHSRKRKRLQDWVDSDLAGRFAGRILDVDLRVAARWGEMSGAAEKAGRRVPVLDGLIAATALESGLTVVTGNAQHFAVTGVRWLDPARVAE